MASVEALEAQYKTTYNISIVALEEAKGTLLAYDNIAVAEGPLPKKAYIQARDIQGAHRQFHIRPDGPMMPEKPVGPPNADTVTYSILTSASSNGGSPTTLIAGAVVQTGAGGVGGPDDPEGETGLHLPLHAVVVTALEGKIGGAFRIPDHQKFESAPAAFARE